MPRPSATLIALLLALPVQGASAQEAHRRLLADRFRAELAEIAAASPGISGIAAVDLTTGERFGVNDTLTFPQGSSIKVPLLLALYRQAEVGTLRLDERVPVRAADRAGGSGILQHFGDTTAVLSLRDLAVLMIVLSDNTATNMLIDRVGMDRVNALMRELGAPGTRLQRAMIRPAESARGRENISTPAQAAALMRRIARCDLPLSPASCADVRRILEIPKSGSLPDAVPSGAALAFKEGSISGVRAAWGIVELPGRPYVIAVMTNYAREDEGEQVITQAAAAAQYYFSRLAGATAHGTRVPLDLLGDSTQRRP